MQRSAAITQHLVHNHGASTPQFRVRLYGSDLPFVIVVGDVMSITLHVEPDLLAYIELPVSQSIYSSTLFDMPAAAQ